MMLTILPVFLLPFEFYSFFTISTMLEVKKSNITELDQFNLEYRGLPGITCGTRHFFNTTINIFIY